MKQLNESEMNMYNGGWKYSTDKDLPFRDYKAGDEYRYSGTYSNGIFGIRGKVAYRPTVNSDGGYKYRTA